MSDQAEPRPSEARIPTLPTDPERRMRAIDDAWEAAVREELTRIRRGHARDRRFTRPDQQP